MWNYELNKCDKRQDRKSPCREAACRTEKRVTNDGRIMSGWPVLRLHLEGHREPEAPV